MKGYCTIARQPRLTPLRLAKYIASFASDKKAEDIVVLDMRKQVNFCDYFVLCSGNTDRQTKAVADAIEEGLNKIGEPVKINKNLKDYSWVVVDTGTVIAHIFVKDLREYYNLEYLWREAKPVNWDK